jgi:hypothetical protein
MVLIVTQKSSTQPKYKVINGPTFNSHQALMMWIINEERHYPIKWEIIK